MKKKNIILLLAIATAITMIAVAIIVRAGSNNCNKARSCSCNKPEHIEVTICHRTAANNNPYVLLTVDDDAVDGEGNNDHTHHVQDDNHSRGDIIPITDLDDDGDIDLDDCNYEEPEEIEEPFESNINPEETFDIVLDDVNLNIDTSDDDDSDNDNDNDDDNDDNDDDEITTIDVPVPQVPETPVQMNIPDDATAPVTGMGSL